MMTENERRERSRFSLRLRALAGALVLTLVAQDVVMAQGGTPLWQSITRQSAGADESAASGNVAISAEDGLVRRHVVDGNETIINIQDAHQKIDAQRSIARILDNLVRNYKLEMVAVEGGFGRIDTSLLSAHPSGDARRRIGDYLLSEGRISAAELYSILSDKPVSIEGVEERATYDENVDAFKRIIDRKLAVREQLTELNRVAHQLQAAIYPAELNALLEKRIEHKTGSLKFADYWQAYGEAAGRMGIDVSAHPNLSRLADVVRLESEIDFPAAEAERSALVDELSTKLGKEDLQTLIVAGLQFKQNRITPGRFHYVLGECAERSGIDAKRYPNLIRYAEYLLVFEGIDLVTLFDEMSAFEESVAAKYLSTDDQRSLQETLRCVRVLTDLLDTMLDSKAYGYLKTHAAECTVTAVAERLTALGRAHGIDVAARVDLDVLEEGVPDALLFYEVAERRNRELLDNTLKKMRAEGTHVAALVTGGFHSEGIAELMGGEKLSYLVVMPKFESQGADRPYIAILTKKPRSYEEQFKGSDFYLAPPHVFDLAGDYPDRDTQLAHVAALLASTRLADGAERTTREERVEYVRRYSAAYGLLKDQAVSAGLMTPDELGLLLESARVQPKDQDSIEVRLGDRTYIYTVSGTGAERKVTGDPIIRTGASSVTSVPDVAATLTGPVTLEPGLFADILARALADSRQVFAANTTIDTRAATEAVLDRIRRGARSKGAELSQDQVLEATEAAARLVTAVPVAATEPVSTGARLADDARQRAIELVLAERIPVGGTADVLGYEIDLEGPVEKEMNAREVVLSSKPVEETGDDYWTGSTAVDYLALTPRVATVVIGSNTAARRSVSRGPKRNEAQAMRNFALMLGLRDALESNDTALEVFRRINRIEGGPGASTVEMGRAMLRVVERRDYVSPQEYITTLERAADLQAALATEPEAAEQFKKDHDLRSIDLTDRDAARFLLNIAGADGYLGADNAVKDLIERARRPAPKAPSLWRWLFGLEKKAVPRKQPQRVFGAQQLETREMKDAAGLFSAMTDTVDVRPEYADVYVMTAPADLNNPAFVDHAESAGSDQSRDRTAAEAYLGWEPGQGAVYTTDADFVDTLVHQASQHALIKADPGLQAALREMYPALSGVDFVSTPDAQSGRFDYVDDYGVPVSGATDQVYLTILADRGFNVEQFRSSAAKAGSLHTALGPADSPVRAQLAETYGIEGEQTFDNPSYRNFMLRTVSANDYDQEAFLASFGPQIQPQAGPTDFDADVQTIMTSLLDSPEFERLWNIPPVGDPRRTEIEDGRIKDFTGSLAVQILEDPKLDGLSPAERADFYLRQVFSAQLAILEHPTAARDLEYIQNLNEGALRGFFDYRFPTFGANGQLTPAGTVRNIVIQAAQNHIISENNYQTEGFRINIDTGVLGTYAIDPAHTTLDQTIQSIHRQRLILEDPRSTAILELYGIERTDTKLLGQILGDLESQIFVEGFRETGTRVKDFTTGEEESYPLVRYATEAEAIDAVLGGVEAQLAFVQDSEIYDFTRQVFGLTNDAGQLQGFRGAAATDVLGTLRAPYVRQMVSENAGSAAYWRQVRSVRDELVSRNLSGFVSEVFGVDLTQPLTAQGVTALNLQGLFYNANGSLRSASQVADFFQAVADFRTESLKDAEATALLNEVFNIDLTDGVSATELTIFGGPNGILYRADGTLRNPAETVAFFRAVADLRQAILASPDRTGLMRLFREAYGIELMDGIDPADLTTFASSSLSIIYDDKGNIRELKASMAFYEAAVHFNTAYEALSAADRGKVDQILRILGVDTSTGLFTPDNLRVLADEGVLFGTVKDVNGVDVQVERDHAKTLRFYVFAIDLRDDLIALEKVDPKLARAIDDLFSEMFGFRLLDGIQKPEIPKIANALFKEDGTLRDPKEVLEYFKRLVRERAGAGLFFGGAAAFPGFGGGGGYGVGGFGPGGPGGGGWGPGASKPREEPGRIRFETILIDHEWRVPESQYQEPSPAEQAQSAAERRARQEAQVQEEQQAADQAIETARQFLALYDQFRDFMLSLQWPQGTGPSGSPEGAAPADMGPAAPAEGYVMSDRTRAVLLALSAAGILLTAVYYLRRRREAGRLLTQEEERILQEAERILRDMRRPAEEPVTRPITEPATEPVSEPITEPITTVEERRAPEVPEVRAGPNPIDDIRAARERLRDLQVDLVRVSATVADSEGARALAQEIGDEVAAIHERLIERYGYGFERLTRAELAEAVRGLRAERIEIAERLAELRAQDTPDAEALSAAERRHQALTEMIDGVPDDLIRQVETDIDYFAVNLSKYGAAYAPPATVTPEIAEIFERIKGDRVFREAYRQATGRDLPADLGDTVAARSVVLFIEAIRRTQPRPLEPTVGPAVEAEPSAEPTREAIEELARPAIQRVRSEHGRRWVRNTFLAIGIMIALPVLLLVGVPLVLAWLAQATTPAVPTRVEQPAAIIAPAEPGPRPAFNLGFLLPDLGPAFEAKVPELRIRIMLAAPTTEEKAVLQDAQRAQEIQTELKTLNNELTRLKAQIAKSPTAPESVAAQKRVAEINERVFALIGNPFAYDLSDNTLQRPIDYYQRKTQLLVQLAAEIRKQPAGREEELRDLEQNRIPAAKSLVSTLEQRAKVVKDYREKARLSIERAMAALMTSPSEIGAPRPRSDWDRPIPGLQGETYGMFRVTAPGTPRAYAGQVKIFWNTSKGEFDFEIVGQYSEGQLPKDVRAKFDVQSSRYYFHDAATGTFFFRYAQGREILFEKGKGIHSMLPLVDEIAKFGGLAKPGQGRQLYPKVRPPFATVEPVTKDRFDAVNRDRGRWRDMGVVGTVELDGNGNVRSVIFRGGLDATDIRTGSLYVLTPGGGYQMKWVDRQTGQIRQGGFSVSNLEIVSFTSIEDADIQELGLTVPWLSEQKLRFDVIGGVIGDGAKGPVERGTWLFAEAPYFFLGDQAYLGFAEGELPGVVQQLYAQLQRQPTDVNQRLLDRAAEDGVTVDRQKGLRAAHPSTGYSQTKAVEALLGYGGQTLWVSEQFGILLEPWGAAAPDQGPLVQVDPLAPQAALGGQAKDTARTAQVVPGVPLTALPAELSIDNKIRIPMLPADKYGKHREAPGVTKGQPGRTWNVVKGSDGRFEAIEVLDARGKVDFVLTGNVRINGKAVESVDFTATPLQATDQISADFITVVHKTALGHVTGSTTSTVTRIFTYGSVNPHDAAASPVGVDRRQTISLGTTADGLYDVFEVRTYLLDGKGELVRKDGGALYVAQVEYRRKADNSRALAVYGDARLEIVAGQLPTVSKGPTGDSAGEVEIVDPTHPGRALIYRYDTAKGAALTGPIAVLQRQPLKASFKGASYDVFIRTGSGGLVEKVFAVDPDLGERLLFQANALGKMEVLDVPTGDIYALEGTTGYTVGGLIATTERKGTVTVGDVAYPVLLRHPVADPTRVEQAIAVDVRGTTVVRYYQKSAGVWEAEVVATGEVRQADAATYALGDPAGTIRATGTTVTVAGTVYTLKERLDNDGKVIGVFGFDRIGRLGLNYFRSPAGVWLEAEAGGAVYPVTDQKTYALGEASIGTIERGVEVTVGDNAYAVRTRKDDAGKVLRVFAIDAFGNEGLRYALDGTGKATEVEHVPTGNIYGVREGLAIGDQLATTSTIKGGLTIDGLPYDIKVQTDTDGTFRRAFAIDAQGKEVATYYRRPGVTDGQQVSGLWVIDQGKTAAQVLPAGVVAAQGYSGAEPARIIRYADSKYAVIEGLGVKGYTVATSRTVAHKGESWTITDELDTNGRFLIGRSVDINGKEKATVTRMPEGVYQIEIVEKNVNEIRPGAARQLIRTAYTGTLKGGVFTPDQSIVQTAYVTAYKVDLDAAKMPAQLTALVLDATDIPDASKPAANAKLEQSIRAIAVSVGAQKSVTLVKTEVSMSNGSRSYFYRLLEDDWARVVIFRSSDIEANAVINVEWDQSSGRKGYEFSPMGLIYLQEAGSPTVTSDDLLRDHQLTQVKADILARGVQLPTEPFSKVTRSLLVGGDETRKVPMDIRYLLPNDPSARDFARVSRGSVRFIKWSQDPRVPYGVAAGEVVAVGGAHQEILRETAFLTWDKDRNEYIYRMVTELRNGQRMSDPHVLVGYNVTTGLLWEHYVDEEWKLYSKDGFPLYIHRISSTSDPVAGPYASRTYESPFDGKTYGVQGKEYLHSTFVTRAWVHPTSGDVFVLTSEKFDTPTPFYGPSNFLVRNGELIAIIEGDDANRLVHIDPYRNPITEKVYNSLPGVITRGVAGWTGTETHEAIADRIDREGETVDLREPDTSTRDQLDVYFDPLRYAMQNWWILALLGGAGVLSIPVAMRYLGRKDRGNNASNPSAGDLNALDQVFIEGLGEPTDTLPPTTDTDAAGARLAEDRTPIDIETADLDEEQTYSGARLAAGLTPIPDAPDAAFMDLISKVYLPSLNTGGAALTQLAIPPFDDEIYTESIPEPVALRSRVYGADGQVRPDLLENFLENELDHSVLFGLMAGAAQRYSVMVGGQAKGTMSLKNMLDLKPSLEALRDQYAQLYAELSADVNAPSASQASSALASKVATTFGKPDYATPGQVQTYTSNAALVDLGGSKAGASDAENFLANYKIALELLSATAQVETFLSTAQATGDTKATDYLNLSLGSMHVAAYAMRLRQLAGQRYDLQQRKAGQPVDAQKRVEYIEDFMRNSAQAVLNVNEETASLVLEDLKAWNFFGLNPERVVFVLSPNIPVVVKDPADNTKYTFMTPEVAAQMGATQLRHPYGHAFILALLYFPDSAFRYDTTSNTLTPLGKPALAYMTEDLKAWNFVQRNIDDLGGISPDDVLPPGAYLLADPAFRAQGYHGVAEVNINATGQPGGGHILERRDGVSEPVVRIMEDKELKNLEAALQQKYPSKQPTEIKKMVADVTAAGPGSYINRMQFTFDGRALPKADGTADELMKHLTHAVWATKNASFGQYGFFEAYFSTVLTETLDLMVGYDGLDKTSVPINPAVKSPLHAAKIGKEPGFVGRVVANYARTDYAEFVASNKSGARLALPTSHRYAQHLELAGPLVIPDHIEGDARRRYALRHFEANGFTPAEAVAIYDRFKGDFRDREIDPKDPARRAPAITPASAWQDLQDAKAYTKAIVIRDILSSGLLGDEAQSREVFERTVAQHSAGGPVEGKRAALLWDAVQKSLVSQAQSAALQRIAAGDLDVIDDLPYTPTANTLRRIRDLITVEAPNERAQALGQALAAQAATAPDLELLVQGVIREAVVRPQFDRVREASFGSAIPEHAATTIFEGVLAEVYPFVARDPSLLDEYVTTGQVTYNAESIIPQMEARDLTELTLSKFLQLTATLSGGHALKQAVTFAPFVLFVARDLKARLNGAQGAAAVLDHLAVIRKIFVTTMNREIGKERYAAITERKPWLPTEQVLGDLFADSELFDLFEIAARKGLTLQQILPGQDLAALAVEASSGDAARMEAVADLLRKRTDELFKEAHPKAAAADERARRPKGKGLGLYEVYVNRLLGSLTDVMDFWGLRKTSPLNKLLFGVTAATLTAAGVFIMINGSLALGLMLVGAVPMILPLVFGKASSETGRWFFLPVMTAANVYVLGILTHHLYWKLILINPLSLGFLSTTALILLMFVPTIMSVYHITKGIYSLVVLNDQFWSDTARGLTGWRSLFRLSGHWPDTFGAWYSEIRGAEEASGPLLSTGESYGQYLSRLVEDLRANKLLLSDREAQQWQAAIAGQGRFVVPASKKAFDILKLAFHAVSQKKPALDPYELLQPTSSHVMGAGELITHTFANTATLGTFSPDPEDPNRLTSLLGYTARTHPAEWSNLIDRLRQEGTPEPYLQALRGANEWVDLKALVYDGVTGTQVLTPLDPDQRAVVVSNIERWMNEIRPNDAAVIHGLAQDHLEYHLRFSYESGDLGYHRAVKAVTAAGRTIQEVFESERGSALSVPEELVQRWLDRDPTLSAEESLAAATRVFVESYERYAAKTAPKLRHIYKSVPLYLSFAGESGGYNITATPAAELSGKLAALTPETLNTAELTAARDTLVAGLADFDPAKAADKSIFATIDQWAAQYTEWRRSVDAQIVAVLAASVPAKRAELLASLDKLDQSAAVVVRANASGVTYSFHNRGDELLPIKNAAIGADLWQFYPRQVDYDAHVRTYPGQNVWRANWATYQSQVRGPERAAVSMMMKIWASSTDAFPVTRLYSIAQEVWTGDVQRATRGGLTFYGKGGVALYMIALLKPPGEDSSANFLGQRSQPRLIGTQIEYFAMEWGRPVADVTATEMRYGMNVTRFVMDRGQFAVLSNPDLGFDVKLSHVFLWSHYFTAIFAIALIVALPILSPFSSLAFLKPFAFFVGASFMLLEAINVNDFVRHWRDSGSLWVGIGRTLSDIWFAMPFYVFMIPFFFRGVWLASLERFEFIRTEKEALLAKLTPDQRFEQQLLFKLLGEKGFPFNNVISLLGLIGFGVAVFMMTPYGPLILLPYFLASVYIGAGDTVTGVYKDRNGNLVGYNWFAPFKYTPRRIVLTLKALWVWVRSPRVSPPVAPVTPVVPATPPNRPAGARLASWSQVTDDQVRTWAQDFSRQIDLRGGSGAAFPNIETAVAAPTGEEKETALYIDLGGTNLRIGSATLNGDRTLQVDPEPLKKVIPGEHVTGGGNSLIRYVAQQVKAYAEQKGLSADQQYKLGFTFSFPLEKSDIRTGVVAPDAQGVKGFDFSQLIARGQSSEREDLVSILEKELASIGVNNIRITALVNDTESTRDLGQYLDPRTLAGVIVGTGHNIAIRKYGRSVNLESARFAGFDRDADDEQLDRLSVNPGKQLLEKALSGKYLGPLAGIKIDRLVSEGALFGGETSVRIQDHQYEQADYYQGVSSLFLSTLLALDLSTPEGEAAAIREVREYMQVRSVGRADVEALVEVARDVVTRSAHLVGGVALAGVLLDHEGTAVPTGEYAFALDGSLLRIPGYMEAVRDGLKRVFPADYVDTRITLFEAPDGSGAGAAVTAAIAERAGARLAEAPAVDVLVAPIEVGIVAADGPSGQRRLEAVRGLLPAELSGQFAFRTLERAQVDDYIGAAGEGVYRVLVGEDAFADGQDLLRQSADVLTRLVDIASERQARSQRQAERTEALLSFIAALVDETAVVSADGAVDTQALGIRIEDLRRILRALPLPGVGPIEAIRTGSGVRLFASGRFVAEGPLDEARLAVLLERAFVSESDQDRVTAVREALSVILAASGDTEAAGFVAQASAAVGAALRAYASIVRRQTTLEPAEVREGVKTIAVMDAMFRGNEERYLEEAGYIAGLDPGMRFVIVVPVTEEYRGLSYADQASLYLQNNPVTGPFELVFVQDASSLAAVQAAIEGPLVLAGGESLQVGELAPESEALLMQIDARAESHRGVMVVAAKILYAGPQATVPGLRVLGERVLRYLPAVRPLELLKLLKQANTAIRAVGAAA